MKQNRNVKILIVKDDAQKLERVEQLASKVLSSGSRIELETALHEIHRVVTRGEVAR